MITEYLRQVRSVFVSLRLTVVLIALSIVLVFWATLDQVHLGVWGVQQKFFHSFLVYQGLGELRIPVYPGGYLIGGLLLVNLLSAHLYRFKAGWRKSGIWIAHAGLVLLLLGELASGLPIKQGAWMGRLKCEQIDLVLRTQLPATHRKAEGELGYQPRPLDETLRDTCVWMKTQGWL